MHKKFWLNLFLLASLLLSLASPGAVRADEASLPSAVPPPPPELAQGGQPLSAVPQISMPAVDVEALLAEDLERLAAGLPQRFAQPIPVQLSPANSGAWESLPDGSWLWRLRIAAPGALSLNLGFATYWMPEGGRLFLYTPDYQTIRGPFTAADNEAHGQFWSPILEADEIVIEVSLPAQSRPRLQLELTSVNHGYIEFGESPFSGTCNRDVICPEGDPWRDEIRSVGVISTGGSTFCTGFLVNNTAQDLTPYFMTANHCGINSGNAPSLVVYWNYEQTYCRDVGSNEPGDGSLDQFQTGSIWRSGNGASDFTLVELDDFPLPEFNVHWAGWDHTAADPTSAVAIHHPNTDEKRISFEYDPTSTTSYLGTSVPGDGTHIRVTDWDLGTTEPGSSGSPLFDQNHHIVGQLHGGYAACGNDDSDWYGRFSVSWTGGGSNSTRLSNWLDPTNSGVPFLDGRDLIESPFVLLPQPAALDVCAPADAVYAITVTQETPGFSSPVSLEAFNYPPNTVPAFDPNPVIPEATVAFSLTNTGAAPEGSYAIDVVGTGPTSTFTATVALNLFATAPLSPSLLTPADGAINQPLTPDFTWQPGSLTGLYSFELAFTPSFDPPLMQAGGLADPAFTPSTPLEGGRCYWWRVQGENTCGVGSWSEAFHFATVALQSVFFDDMENGSGNWTHQAGSGTDAWALVTDQSHSPTHAWFHPDPATVTDSRLWNTTPVQVGAGSTLTFWHRYQFENGYDGAVLEISPDGGGTWTDLGPYITAGGYNGTISTCCSNPLGGRSAWTNDLTTWTQVEVDLNSYAGQSVQVRWRMGADSSVSDAGWYIDDVQLNAPLPPNPAPALLTITPDSGSTYEPTPVVIEGTGFVDTPSLQLGETWLLSVTLVSSTTIQAVVPAGMPGGVYDLMLINGDCQTDVLVDAFTVTTIEQPITGLEAFNDSPTYLSNATALSATVETGTNISYAWDFGDGATGAGAEVTHIYPQMGVYTAVVTASNSISTAVATTIVEVVEEPVAGLAAENDSPTTLGGATTLTATVTAGTNVTYAWDFGDDTTGDGATLTHTYPASGVYTAVVTASNSANFEVATTLVQIGDVPISGLAAENDSPTPLGEATTLTATVSLGTGVSYAWDFGDGETGSGAQVTHVYPATGIYTAVVTASNTVNQQITETIVTVVNVPIAGLTAENDGPTTLGDVTVFTATITAGSAVTYTWDFGDGETGTGIVATHVYTATGVYTATVTASNVLGSVEAITVVTVVAPPRLMFFLPIVNRQ